MAHKVTMNADLVSEVGNNDIVFLIDEDGEKLGELRVSRGALVWRGSYDKIDRELRWAEFNKMIQNHFNP